MWTVNDFIHSSYFARFARSVSAKKFIFCTCSILAALGIVAGAMHIPDARSCASNAPLMDPMERIFELHITNGAVAEDSRTVRVMEGDTVRLRWTADEPVVLHLQGYDMETTVAPGGMTEIAFEADVTGRFPVAAQGEPGSQGSAGHRGPLVIVEIFPR